MAIGMRGEAQPLADPQWSQTFVMLRLRPIARPVVDDLVAFAQEGWKCNVIGLAAQEGGDL